MNAATSKSIRICQYPSDGSVWNLAQLNVPSKTYSIMASGRPVIAAVPGDSEITDLVQEADCGVWVPPEDPKSLAKAIHSLSKQPELLKRLGANGRKYVCEHFDRKILTRPTLSPVVTSGSPHKILVQKEEKCFPAYCYSNQA